jgi:hypothetical protein
MKEVLVVYALADIDLPWQGSVYEHTLRFTLFLSVLALIIAKNHPREGEIRLFCKFKIITDDMANNGAFGILDCF